MTTTADEHAHPLDAFVVDPTGMEPLCDADEFAELLDGMVADAAPRLFAVVQEYGDRVDATIAAWGIAFEDRAEVVAVEGGLRMSLREPGNALRGFGYGTHITAKLVWFNPDAVTPAPEEDDEE